MRTITWIGITIWFWLAGVGRGAVLLNEPFTNCQSVAQHWITGGPAKNMTVTNGALVLVNPPSGEPRGALAYLTNVGHRQLHPGDELTLTFKYSFGQADPGDWGLIFGFFDSNGSRMYDHNGSYNDEVFAEYRGYVGAGVFGPSKAERFKIARRTGTANNLLNSANYEILGKPVAQTVGKLPGKPYPVIFKLTCVAPGQLKATATIDHQTITCKDSPALTTFDTVAIFSTRHNFQLTIQSVLVDHAVADGGKNAGVVGSSHP